MSENTKIEWCDHTFNPWVGCTKISPACDHCYAEGWAKRSGSVEWGGDRRRTTPANWRKPMQWQAKSAEFMAQHGRRQRVFCASLADVFDNQVPDAWRRDLFQLIAETPDLDWLLLTKRIGNSGDMIVNALLQQPGLESHVPRWPWPNIWIGATICNQAEADRDIPKLLAVPAKVRFLSMEPLLGPVSFEGIFANPADFRDGTNALEALDWVIVGGESGPGARPMHPDWARSLRDQCQAAGVPFLFKQWGEWAESGPRPGLMARAVSPSGVTRPCAGTHDLCEALMEPIGKKSAGRLLDGVEHNEFPEVS